MSAVENPPAFPCRLHPDSFEGRNMGGMSLRDWFAGRAMAALIPLNITDAGGYSLPVNERTAARARKAYAYADAMLAARSTFNDADNQREDG